MWRYSFGKRVQDSEFMVYGSWFRVQGLGFKVEGFGFRVKGVGFRVRGLGFRVKDVGFRVRGLGFRVESERASAVLSRVLLSPHGGLQKSTYSSYTSILGDI